MLYTTQFLAPQDLKRSITEIGQSDSDSAQMLSSLDTSYMQTSL